MFSTFHISYSPAIVCIAQVTKGNEGVDLEKLAIVSTYALPVSELLGLNGFRVQDGELDANNTHSGFFRFLIPLNANATSGSIVVSLGK